MPRTITQQQLEQWGCCRHGILGFARLFPGQATLTRRNIMLAANHGDGLSVWWLAKWIMTEEQLNKYYTLSWETWNLYMKCKNNKLAKKYNVLLAECMCDVLELT